MSKMRQRQLELPILTNVINSQTLRINNNNKSGFATHAIGSGGVGFHQPASKDDQSIYESMSESYFAVKSK